MILLFIFFLFHVNVCDMQIIYDDNIIINNLRNCNITWKQLGYSLFEMLQDSWHFTTSKRSPSRQPSGRVTPVTSPHSCLVR